jgi:hypothetical protein
MNKKEEKLLKREYNHQKTERETTGKNKCVFAFVAVRTH